MKEISKEQFAANLKSLRTEHGFTQEEMAELLGISRPAYTQYERMKTLPSTKNFVKLASFFDISVAALTGGKGDVA